MVSPREVKACFLGHFTAWVESDRDVFVQLNDKLINSAGQTGFMQDCLKYSCGTKAAQF